jgi:hypothetical protein
MRRVLTKERLATTRATRIPIVNCHFRTTTFLLDAAMSERVGETHEPLISVSVAALRRRGDWATYSAGSGPDSCISDAMYARLARILSTAEIMKP